MIGYTTSEETIARVGPGQRIFTGAGAAEPIALVEAAGPRRDAPGAGT